MSQVSRRERLERRLETAVTRVSKAIRQLVSATGGQLGYDCAMHATLGRELLADMDFHANRVVGYAAWRVGAGRGDVLSHVPNTPSFKLAGVQAAVYHAWLQCQGFVIDFSTYQFRLKAQMLDALDGSYTTVSWCPDYLLLPVYRSVRLADVAKTTRVGVAYYEVRPELESAAQYELDPVDLKNARLILALSPVNVVGPTNEGRAFSSQLL